MKELEGEEWYNFFFTEMSKYFHVYYSIVSGEKIPFENFKNSKYIHESYSVIYDSGKKIDIQVILANICITVSYELNKLEERLTTKNDVKEFAVRADYCMKKSIYNILQSRLNNENKSCYNPEYEQKKVYLKEHDLIEMPLKINYDNQS